MRLVFVSLVTVRDILQSTTVIAVNINVANKLTYIPGICVDVFCVDHQENCPGVIGCELLSRKL